jgi:hypothetical protein
VRICQVCPILIFKFVSSRFITFLKFIYTSKYITDIFSFLLSVSESCDSSVGIALGYRLDDQGSSVQFLVGAGNFSLHHHVQNGSGAHPASYPMGTRGSFLGGKAAGV